MDPHDVLALCHEHAAAEADFDVDRVLATFVPVPCFEFFPLAKSMSGWANVERFYRDQYPKFAELVSDFELLDEWSNEKTALQEYMIEVQRDGRTSAYRVISMMPVDEETGLLAGERLFCDKGFVRALLGPLCDLLDPVGS
jgi:hypothetical protein